MSKKLKKNFKVNFLMNVAGGIQVKKLNKAAKNCEKAQDATLRAILEYAKDTEWGKAHNYAEILTAKTPAELQQKWEANVPACQYEDIRPLVERHKNGEENLLFPIITGFRFVEPTLKATSFFFIGLLVFILSLCFSSFIGLYSDLYFFISSVHTKWKPPIPPLSRLQIHCPDFLRLKIRSFSALNASSSVSKYSIILLSHLC